MPQSSPPPPDEVLLSERSDIEVETAWQVDCDTEETFLFASMTNVAKMGIFVRTDDPLAIGTIVCLRFAPNDEPIAFTMRGQVQWVNRVHFFGENLNPGMGILFLDLDPSERHKLVSAVRTIAYLRSEPSDISYN